MATIKITPVIFTSKNYINNTADNFKRGTEMKSIVYIFNLRKTENIQGGKS